MQVDILSLTVLHVCNLLFPCKRRVKSRLDPWPDHSAGLGGTTFSSLNDTNLPAGFRSSLIYTGTDVLLDLSDSFDRTGLNGNNRNVADALNSFFNNGGTLPPRFVTIFGLTGGNLGASLSQLSGEAATGGQQSSYQLMNRFLEMIFAPFANGGDGSSGFGFASERKVFSPDMTFAYAANDAVSMSDAGLPKAPVRKADPEQRLTVWGSAYGGYNKTDGDATAGTTTIDSRTYGFAAGMDYHVTPNTMGGITLGGAGTNWSLSQGLGSGNSDTFQIGLYGRTKFGSAYLMGALAFTNHWMTTDRYAYGGRTS
jgi:hypothetical protein